MTPTENYIKEIENIKEQRVERLLASSFELFSQKGIDNISMIDIAKKAEIGVASIYRYFETKEEVAIQTATWAWKKEKEIILPLLQGENYETATGIDQISMICDMFVTLLDKESDFLRFISFFDQFVVRGFIPMARLYEYQKMIESVQKIVEAAIKKGLADGTINPLYKNSEDVLYFTLMHTLFNTAQKLCLTGNMLEMDLHVSGITELQTLSKILVGGIKNENIIKK